MKLRLGGKWWQYKTSRKLTASAGYCDSAKLTLVVDSRLLMDDDFRRHPA
jgi:hypothetical protein